MPNVSNVPVDINIEIDVVAKQTIPASNGINEEHGIPFVNIYEPSN